MKRFLLAASFMLFVGCNVYEHASNSIQEIQFTPIELSDENIKKYSFLEKYRAENEEFRKKYDANYMQDLTLPDEFSQIKVGIAENVVYNGSNYILLYIMGGYGQYCSNAGCSIAVYDKYGQNYGGFSTGSAKVSFIQSGVYKLACKNKDFFIAGTGPGVDKPAYKVLVEKNRNFRIQFNSNNSDALSICTTYNKGLKK